ncbi:MAG: hypothetical protein IJZ89_03210 [Clostridia bacterium]|nr:hypothetical protein [Clostridia bacterium]
MKNNDINLREKVDAAKTRLEKQTFKVGGLSIKLTSTLMYVCCLLCAIFIWSNVTERNAETSSRRFDNVSVVVEGESALLKNNLAVFELIDKTVSVTVEGAKNKVDALTDEDIVAYVNVGEVSEAGTVRLAVSVKGADKLDAVVSPSSVKTFIDEMVEVDIPVSVIPTYSIISEYDHVLSANLETVTVTGAKSIVEKVKEARATPELGELTTSTTASSPIRLVDGNGAEIDSSYITSAVRTVVVNVEVYTEKTVPLTYTYKYGYIQDRNISVTLSPSEITLRGDPMVLSEIENIHLTEIDETKVSGNTEMVVGVKLPAGVTDVNQVNGFSVDIELLRYTGETIEIPIDNITVKNPGGYTYSFSDEVYSLRYIVDSSSSKKVKAENFNIELDLTSAASSGVGSYKLTPRVTVEDVGFTLYPIIAGQINVEIIGAGS